MKVQPAECRGIVEALDGTDYLVTIERDEDGDHFITIMLEDWMSTNGYKSRDSLVCTVEDEEEVERLWDAMLEEFEEFCDDNGWTGQEV